MADLLPAIVWERIREMREGGWTGSITISFNQGIPVNWERRDYGKLTAESRERKPSQEFLERVLAIGEPG